MRIQEPNWEFSLGDGRLTHARALASDDDVASLQQLFEMLPSYCEKTIGFPPGPAEAHSTLTARGPRSAPGPARPGMNDNCSLDHLDAIGCDH